MKLSVIIPAYNEEKTIAALIDRVRHCGVPELEMIVVNDCSRDKTGEVLASLPESPDLKIVNHTKNAGKGAAIRTGQKYVTGDAVVVQDADLEYDPEDFPRMLKILEDGVADVVYGSRYCGESRLVDGFWHAQVNHFLTTFFDLCANISLTDVETCYKMARADFFAKVKLTSDRFGFDPEMTARLVKLHARFFEVPILYHPRRYDEGKKIGWRDGITVIWSTIKFCLLGM